MLRLFIPLKMRAWGHLCESEDHVFQDLRVFISEGISLNTVHNEQLKAMKPLALTNHSCSLLSVSFLRAPSYLPLISWKTSLIGSGELKVLPLCFVTNTFSCYNVYVFTEVIIFQKQKETEAEHRDLDHKPAHHHGSLGRKGAFLPLNLRVHTCTNR